MTPPDIVESIERRSTASVVVAILITFTVLYAARELLVPLVAGVFLNLLLSPAVRGMRRHLRLPSPVGAALVLGLFIAAMGFAFYQLAGPTREWVEQLPSRWGEIEFKIRDLKEPFEDIKAVGREVERVAQLSQNEASPVLEPPEVKVAEEGTLVETILSEGGSMAVTTLIVLLFVFLTLSTSESFLNSVMRALPRLRQQKRTLIIIRTVEAQVTRYLVTISIINGLLGVAVGFMTWSFGLPNPALWGAMAGVLNFVPYVGSLVGIAIVAMASLLTFDTMSAIIAPPLVYLGFTALEGYIFTPMALGRSMSLEPVVVFVSVFFWGWLWGIIGAFVAVPIVIVAKIVFENVESLQAYGRLLGPPAKTAVTPPDPGAA